MLWKHGWSQCPVGTVRWDADRQDDVLSVISELTMFQSNKVQLVFSHEAHCSVSKNSGTVYEGLSSWEVHVISNAVQSLQHRSLSKELFFWSVKRLAVPAIARFT